MSNFVKVATKSELASGTGKKIEIDGKEIALFNVDGNFLAIDNTCPHRGGPLSEGSVETGVVTCPWHGWQFQLETGECLTNPSARQTKYAVKIKGEDILISV